MVFYSRPISPARAVLVGVLFLVTVGLFLDTLFIKRLPLSRSQEVVLLVALLIAIKFAGPRERLTVEINDDGLRISHGKLMPPNPTNPGGARHGMSGIRFKWSEADMLEFVDVRPQFNYAKAILRSTHRNGIGCVLRFSRFTESDAKRMVVLIEGHVQAEAERRGFSGPERS